MIKAIAFDLWETLITDTPELSREQERLRLTRMEEILSAVNEIDRDYAGHCAAARNVAREYFGHDVVLGPMLNELGVKAGPR